MVFSAKQLLDVFPPGNKGTPACGNSPRNPVEARAELWRALALEDGHAASALSARRPKYVLYTDLDCQ
jgi:hypothetical protein